MSDIERHQSQRGNRLPEGSGLIFAILGGLATLPLIAAAVAIGKPLWIILMIWAVGGTAITFGFALIAHSQRQNNAGAPGDWREEWPSHV